MGMYGLTICKGAKLGIVTSSGFLCFTHEFPVEIIATGNQFRLFLTCLCELLLYRGFSVGIPVRPQIFTKILNRTDIIIAYHHRTGRGLCLTMFSRH